MCAINAFESQVSIRTPDGTADGFLYTPRNDARATSASHWPAAMHLVDIGGIRDSHRGMAKRLASQGYVVLLPNVFYRVGKAPFFAWPMKMDDEPTMRRLGELRDSTFPPAAMAADGGAYIDFLAKQDSVSAAGMGVVGYCFTGAMALRIAASSADKIAAATSLPRRPALHGRSDKSPHTVTAGESQTLMLRTRHRRSQYAQRGYRQVRPRIGCLGRENTKAKPTKARITDGQCRIAHPTTTRKPSARSKSSRHSLPQHCNESPLRQSDKPTHDSPSSAFSRRNA